MHHKFLLASTALLLLVSSLLIAKAIPITWETSAEAYKGKYGQQVTVQLPAGGYARPVHGFGEYDWNSSIGSAAVAMELLTYADGGTVTILIKEGPENYKFDDRYTGWNTTFVFLDSEGNVIEPLLEDELFKDIPSGPLVPSASPEPTFFTVSNFTGTTLTYLAVSSVEMRAMGEHGTNLLKTKPLPHGQSALISFSEHPDLRQAMLHPPNQVLQVDAASVQQQHYHRTYQSDGTNLHIRIYPEDQQKQYPMDTLKITNETELPIVELYLLTPQMDAELDYSKEILGQKVIEPGETLVIDLEDWPYLRAFLQTQTQEILSIQAYDDDDYPLFQYWLPDSEHLQIVLRNWDYL